MKLIDEKIIEAETEFLSSNELGMFENGIEWAEEKLLPKMIEFAEWCNENFSEIKSPHEPKYWIHNSREGYTPTTAQLLDIWIEQTKT